MPPKWSPKSILNSYTKLSFWRFFRLSCCSRLFGFHSKWLLLRRIGRIIKRTVKYEEVYLREYGDGHELTRSLRQYFEYYNYHRPHRSLGYKTPAEVYQAGRQSLRSAPVLFPLSEATGLNKTLQLTF
jgi:putative transposase